MVVLVIVYNFNIDNNKHYQSMYDIVYWKEIGDENTMTVDDYLKTHEIVKEIPTYKVDNMFTRHYTEVQTEFPIGSYVSAPIYDLRHTGLWDNQIVKIINYTSEDKMNQGYRFGAIIAFDSNVYWVDPADMHHVNN